ncbi:olfactory receptor 4A15-like [Betta splendens]|uniref:Olfactory receptor n=1 Tax=Betta splendens TaxID=158456 RepID=A0A6P7LE07_BETSP|nr:olfactory receptor 4A15-like [Betta splendens]
MEDKSNVTYLTLGGFVVLHEYRYLCFVVMFTVYVLIIGFNSTIVCLIVTHQSLHEPMYIFIAALLINSVLYSSNLYPKLLVDLLSEKQLISFSLCFFQAFIYYTLIVAEILLLTVMAYDRYVSICKPLQYPTVMRKTTVTVFLVLAWLVPSCELAVSMAFNSTLKPCTFTLKGLFCNNSFYKLQCENSLPISHFGLAILVKSTFIPTFFTFFSYTRILLICHRSSKEVRTKAAYTCLPQLLVLFSTICLGLYDALEVRLNVDVPKLTDVLLTLQFMVYYPLFNPIIYGLKMKEISKPLRKLLFNVELH